jgi:protein SCO1/2
MRYLLPLALLLAGCAGEKPLPVLGQVPPFELTDQNGQPFTLASLRGHIWVADFIYTTCPGPCPRMSSKMHSLQQATPADVKLVSFTIDPAHDTPEVLAAYSRNFAADPARWSFLTGPVATLHGLSLDGFHLGSIDATLEHSTRFVLVDAQGQVRATYISGDPDILKRISVDIDRLKKDNLKKS